MWLQVSQRIWINLAFAQLFEIQPKAVDIYFPKMGPTIWDVEETSYIVRCGRSLLRKRDCMIWVGQSHPQHQQLLSYIKGES